MSLVNLNNNLYGSFRHCSGIFYDDRVEDRRVEKKGGSVGIEADHFNGRVIGIILYYRYGGPGRAPHQGDDRRCFRNFAQGLLCSLLFAKRIECSSSFDHPDFRVVLRQESLETSCPQHDAGNVRIHSKHKYRSVTAHYFRNSSCGNLTAHTFVIQNVMKPIVGGQRE